MLTRLDVVCLAKIYDIPTYGYVNITFAMSTANRMRSRIRLVNLLKYKHHFGLSKHSNVHTAFRKAHVWMNENKDD